jgi:hypothetical protein
VHPDDFPQVMAALEAHMQGKCFRYEAEYRIRNRDGHHLWVHDRGRVCEYRGGPANQDIRLSEISASMGDGNRLPRSRSNEKTSP